MEKFEKKDSYYIIAILIGIIVVILAVKLGDNQSVIDYFGFAGTLVSIILAVVAIIYSFYQSSTYENSSSKLEISANKIENVTQNLDKIDELKQATANLIDTYSLIDDKVIKVQQAINDIDSVLKEYATTVQSGLETVETKIIQGLELNRNDIVKSIKNLTNTPENTPTVEGRKVLENKDSIELMVSNMSRFQISFIYYVILLNENNKNSDTNSFCKWTLTNDISPWSTYYNEKKEDAYLFATIGYYSSLLQNLAILGLIGIKGSSNSFNVLDINSILIETIKSKHQIEEYKFKDIETLVNSFN
jgi:hypothetical protein